MRNSVNLLIQALGEKLELLERLRNVLDEERRAVVAIDLPLLEETSREKERLSVEVARHDVRFRETVAVVAEETATPQGTKLRFLVERFQDDERLEVSPMVDNLLTLAEGVERRTRMNADLLKDSLGVINNSMSFFERIFARFDTYNDNGMVKKAEQEHGWSAGRSEMGVLGIFDIGKNSLNVQRLALEVTGENIANVNTDGYTRQKVVLQTARVSLERGFPLGNGVEVAEIQRSYDDFLQNQIKTENTSFGNYDTMRSAMLRVEQVFNELTSDGLGKNLQEFFNSWQDLATNPQGLPERQAVLAKANAMVDTFSRISNFLGNVKLDANQSLEGLASDVNNMTAQIAGFNQQIKDIEIFGGSANELRDQREKLVRDLASTVGVNYIEQSDGTLSVSLMSGPELVSGSQSSPLSLEANSNNSGFYDIYIAPNGGATKINITSIVGGPDNSGGELGAALQIRDTTINGFQASLDELAYKIANQVNQIHSAGFGLTGATGNDFFYLPTTSPPNPVVKGDIVTGSAVVNNLSVTNSLFVGMPVTGSGIPANTVVSRILGPNSVLLSNAATAAGNAQDLSFTGYQYSGSGGISVNITNTNDIAAAGSNPTLAGNGTGDNANALLLADIKTQTFTMSNGSSTLEAFYNAIVGNVGVAKQAADRDTDRSSGVLRQLDTLRESVSGVSMDEELANLIKYQKAYEAASKLISTGSEMYDVLLSLIR